ncbi:MAG: DUF4920 domain-containing protein, partial [Bacteroidota bacterium]|nr:DUF4920 domain-containing protein [Bacteroidota bacterium]
MRTKTFIIIVVLLFTMINLCAADEPYKTYGKEIKMKKVTAFKDAVKKPKKFKNKEILITGKVTAVCQNKGCWMEITDGKEKMRVKFEDYGFFVPYDSKGKKVKVQGKVNRETVSEETFRHWLEDAG